MCEWEEKPPFFPRGQKNPLDYQKKNPGKSTESISATIGIFFPVKNYNVLLEFPQYRLKCFISATL